MAKKKKVKKKTTKNTSRRQVSTAAKKPGSTQTDDKHKAVGPGPVLTPMPTAGRKVTEFEEQLDKQLRTGTESRGRGRPRKEPDPAPVEIDITIVGQAMHIPFDLWAVSQGVDGLKITDQESILIAKPVKQLIDHYLPQIPEIGWAWISLMAVSYSIMKSRLALIAEMKKTKQPPKTRTDAARGSATTQEQGGSHPSATFPSIKEIINPVA